MPNSYLVQTGDSFIEINNVNTSCYLKVWPEEWKRLPCCLANFGSVWKTNLPQCRLVGLVGWWQTQALVRSTRSPHRKEGTGGPLRTISTCSKLLSKEWSCIFPWVQTTRVKLQRAEETCLSHWPCFLRPFLVPNGVPPSLRDHCILLECADRFREMRGVPTFTSTSQCPHPGEISWESETKNNPPGI